MSATGKPEFRKPAPEGAVELAGITSVPELGTLPDGFATFDYANVWFRAGEVLISYHRSWIEPDEEAQQAVTLGERQGTARKPSEMVLRIYPLEWFYDEAAR